MPRILVFGTNRIAHELGELAQELSLDAWLVPDLQPDLTLLHAWQNLTVRQHPKNEAELEELVSGAESAILCGDTDAENLDLAFRLHELRASLRVVIALDHPNLAREIERLVLDKTGWCCALDPFEATAPTFALAALEDGVVSAFEHEQQFHALVRGKNGSGIEMAPGEFMTQAKRLSEFQASREQLQGAAEQLLSQARGTPDLFLSVIAVLVVGLLVSATIFFHNHEHIAWVSSFYFVVTTFCTVGYGDISLKDSDTLSKTVGVLVMLSSMFLTASLFAILTNALVQMRTDRIEGRRRFRIRNHVIVCGLGTLGLQVVRVLRKLRVNAIAIEINREKSSQDELGTLKVPVMIADATQESVLERACLRRARSMVCTIDNDMSSIEIALSARIMRPSLRSVVRIKGDEFALRLQRNLKLHVPLSMASLAAPVLLAQALHPRAKTLMRVGGILQAVVAIPPSLEPTYKLVVEGKENLYLVPATQLDEI